MRRKRKSVVNKHLVVAFQRKKAASAANIRPVPPAAVTRSAPLLLVFEDEVGFKSLELSVAVVCVGVTTAPCELCQLGKLIGAKGRKKKIRHTQ